MVTVHEAEPDDIPHPYARVIGIFHANVALWGGNSPPKHMDILWVCWFGRDLGHKSGWRTRQLHYVSFVESQDPNAYGFLDHASIIQAVHLIPAFSLGTLTADADPSRNADWQEYYVNMYVMLSYFSSFMFQHTY